MIEANAYCPRGQGEPEVPGTVIRDFDIHRDVLGELDWSQDVNSTEVGVQVSNGIVTLSGVVHAPLKKAVAVEAAHRVEGVRAVIDAIRVHVPALDGVPDIEIARGAVSVVEHSVHESVDHVRITVNRGCVTLDGQVHDRQKRLEVERHLRGVAGVTDVVNSISVVDSEVDTGAIHSSIESSFYRLAEQAARRITIEVDGQALLLKGTVDTWAERDEAERAALAAGAARVENLIQVYPHMHAETESMVYIAG